jgi:hypothetical protein
MIGITQTLCGLTDSIDRDTVIPIDDRWRSDHDCCNCFTEIPDCDPQRGAGVIGDLFWSEDPGTYLPESDRTHSDKAHEKDERFPERHKYESIAR